MKLFNKKKKKEDPQENGQDMVASTSPQEDPAIPENQEDNPAPVDPESPADFHDETEAPDKKKEKKGFFSRFRKKKSPDDDGENGGEKEETESVDEGREEETFGDEEEQEPQDEEPEKKKKTGFFKRLRNRMAKTRKAFVNRVDSLVLGKKEIDEDLLEELEEILITSDIGVHTALALIDEVREQVARNDLSNPNELKDALHDKILEFVNVEKVSATDPLSSPHVMMVVGVNGVGKTTTIGKLAARLSGEGKKVLLVAGDTFRAAAVEQLEIWSERVGADIVRHKGKADPSAVVFDGIQAAISRKADVVLIDTAGRLHTKVNLMEELKKIRRTIGKQLPEAPHETLLVLDATTGQNAISQAELFNETTEITGIVLTKLDGTAKGGVVVGICHKLGVPLKFIGIGEKVEDLQPFDPEAFMKALF